MKITVTEEDIKAVFIDNLGNEITVRPCKGITDPYMDKARKAKHTLPCVKLSFKNKHRSSGGDAVLHIPKGMDLEINAAMGTMMWHSEAAKISLKQTE